MSPSEIEELLLLFPDKPIRLTMASGDQIILQSSTSALVDSLSLWIVDFVDIGRRKIGKKMLVSIPNIVTAQPLDTLPPSKPDRRRRK